MKVEIRTGNLQSALLELSKHGGQVFPGRDGRDGVSYVCGSKQIIFWNDNSPKYKQLFELAIVLRMPQPDLVTGGKLVRHILEILKIDYQTTYFHPFWQQLAYKGDHWHYTYYKEGYHGKCYEFDVKSAYWSTFIKGKSVFLQDKSCWLNDNGALHELDCIMQDCPKWFRLQFLGTIASWRMNYYIKEKETENLVLKTRKEISYGALFNSAHRAILDTYKLVKEIHEQLGDNTVRLHTDSFLVKMPQGKICAEEIIYKLQKDGYDISCKKWGETWLKDLNIGFVGKFPIGSRRLAIDYARKEGIKLKLSYTSEEEILLQEFRGKYQFRE